VARRCTECSAQRADNPYTVEVWRVLLVDDSALIRNAMHAALEPYGLDLVQAENGAIAVEKAMAASWDLIFLDVVMPVMDGPAALREIRARGNTTPVVLVTSVSTAAVVAAAVKLGNVSYIAKPFTPDQIRAVATKLLRLDPAALRSPPRLLLQGDPALIPPLRKMLPAHVAIDASSALAQSLDLAETGRRELVLFESSDPLDEVVTIANVLRRALPAAGIFALRDAAAPGFPWQPDEGLDGILPRTPEDAVVRGFLYPNFLRPLVMLLGAAHAVGFSGPREHLPVYVAMLSRTLVERCSGLDETADLQIDLTRMPNDPDAVVAVIDTVNRELRSRGAAPLFRVSSALDADVAERLSGAVVMQVISAR